jgi:hypothetical protein
MRNFKEKLEFGKTGETEIAHWLRDRGNHVLPVYEISENQFKGPAFYTSQGEEIITPDMVTWSKNGILFIEAKHKEAFSWHRKTEKWVTGIDLKHYSDYQLLQARTKTPVWIIFLHRGGIAKDSPTSPAGMFGNDLMFLIANENHRHENWAKGMVYWAIDSLIKLSDYPLPKVI